MSLGQVHGPCRLRLHPFSDSLRPDRTSGTPRAHENVVQWLKHANVCCLLVEKVVKAERDAETERE